MRTHLRKPAKMQSRDSVPLTPKLFIINSGLFSQAGRRGFDPRLPLQPT